MLGARGGGGGLVRCDSDVRVLLGTRAAPAALAGLAVPTWMILGTSAEALLLLPVVANVATTGSGVGAAWEVPVGRNSELLSGTPWLAKY